jgi:5-formyltetrahydrofolate cyclo-ligase
MEQAVHSLKKDLRKMLKARLNNIPIPYRRKASQDIFQQVEQMPAYEMSTAIFCYLAMPQEVQTLHFIDRCLMEGKRIFVPKVTGSDSSDMQVLEVLSLEDIEKFPKSSWGIPEPPSELNESWKSRAYSAIDLVIVPGVGFDASCRRIGHGKITELQ